MPNSLSWVISQISADRKIATLTDASVYDTVSRDDYTIDVTGSHYTASGGAGAALTIAQDEYIPEDYTVILDSRPHNGDGHYRFNIQYTPPGGGFGEHDISLILTPTSEYVYSNMISELSEECCSVDFRMDRIMNLLLVGCFIDSIFVIKDRVAANDLGYTAGQAERLIRRAESIYE